MDVCLTQDEIERLLRQELPRERRAAVREHLRACARCRGLLLASARAGEAVGRILGAAASRAGCPTPEQLGEYAAGTSTRVEEIESHFRSCPVCREEHRALLEIEAELQELARKERPPEAPVTLRHRIRSLFPSRRVGWAAAAACVLAAALLVLAFGRGWFGRMGPSEKDVATVPAEVEKKPAPPDTEGADQQLPPEDHEPAPPGAEGPVLEEYSLPDGMTFDSKEDWTREVEIASLFIAGEGAEGQIAGSPGDRIRVLYPLPGERITKTTPMIRWEAAEGLAALGVEITELPDGDTVVFDASVSGETKIAVPEGRLDRGKSYELAIWDPSQPLSTPERADFTVGSHSEVESLVERVQGISPTAARRMVLGALLEHAGYYRRAHAEYMLAAEMVRATGQRPIQLHKAIERLEGMFDPGSHQSED